MSDKKVEAIRVRYRGIEFRSKLEAQWYLFFQESGANFEYEPTTFDLGYGIRYQPDFLIHDAQIWCDKKLYSCDLYIEAKGIMDDRSEYKIKHFRKPIFVVRNMPMNSRNYYNEFNQIYAENSLWYKNPFISDFSSIYVARDGGVLIDDGSDRYMESYSEEKTIELFQMCKLAKFEKSHSICSWENECEENSYFDDEIPF